MSNDQQELQAYSLSLMPHVEIKHILFLKASITKPAKGQKVLLFMADLESSEINISGAYCAFHLCKTEKYVFIWRSAGRRRFYP